MMNFSCLGSARAIACPNRRPRRFAAGDCPPGAAARTRGGACTPRISFTLVELLVMVSILSILSWLCIYSLGSKREQARRSACLSNTRCIGLGFKQYAVDNGDFFPTGIASANTTFAMLTNGNYLAIGKIYLCPSDTGKTTGWTLSFGAANCSYSCVNLDNKGGALFDDTNSWDNPLIFDAGIGAAGVRVQSLAISSAKWTTSPHGGTSGGNIFYTGGQAAFKRVFDTGKDGTNGVVKIPGPM